MFSPNVPLFIDVRSPSEYQKGAIVGAVNIPLFSDEERAKVGTLYKTIGSDEAKDIGLAIASGKLSDIVSRVKGLNRQGRPIVVYCWRGGMRSKSLVTILELMGIQAYQLTGGYKAYRNRVLNQLQKFSLKPRIFVLCGSTGVGKTALLTKLEARGQAVIDLEHLANHRGSVFGHVGLGKPATAQDFDAHFLDQLQHLNREPCIVVECESKRIGNVYLPDFFHQAMQQGTRILVTASVKTRTHRLMDEYLESDRDLTDAVLASLESLRKRLGNKLTNSLREDFCQGRIAAMVEQLLLNYYDPLYGYEKADPADFDYCVCAENLDEAADHIIGYIKQGGNANAIFG